MYKRIIFEKKQIQNIKVTLSEKEKTLKTLKTNKESTTVALENAKVIKNSYAKQLTNEEKEKGYKMDNICKGIIGFTAYC